MSIFLKKSLESVVEKTKSSGLVKNLTAFDLIIFGLGAIIGTGVFVFTGIVAAEYSGPAVMVSFVIAGVTCIFVALAYTEIASMLPSSGSAYTYTYVAYGEVFAWLMGGILIMELNFGASAVAASWAAFMKTIINYSGIITVPKSISATPFDGGIFNLLSVIITFFVTIVLYLGTKDSKKLNGFLVFLKIAAILVFVIAAVPHFDKKYWSNFMPFGLNDVFIGASLLFFSYTGFSALAAAAEECKNPEKDMLIGVIGSLLITTILYVIIGGLLTGIAPLDILNIPDSMGAALEYNGNKIGSIIVTVGALCGMVTVLMMNIYAQSRIFYVISVDGLVPRAFSKLHYKYDSPYLGIVFFGIITAIFSAFIPLQLLGQVASMGALADYLIVVTIVVYFRYKYPDVQRSFKCPAVFIIAPIAFIACLYLLLKQIIKDGDILLSGKLFIGWIIVTIMLYFIRNIILRIKSESSTI